MTVEFGDIYLVNFEPSIGKEYRKTRPALIVQAKEITKNSNYISVMPISSKIEKLGTYDVFLKKDKQNRLIKDSVIRVNQISSFDPRRFIQYIGAINSPTSRKVRGYLRKHFGL